MTQETTQADDLDRLRTLLRRYDATEMQQRLEAAEKRRKQLLGLFPREKFATMTLREYSLGHDDGANSLCNWLERRSPELGSIRGGSSMKFMVFQRKTGEWWYKEDEYANEQEAWTALRDGFLQLFEYADAGKFKEIDYIPSLIGAMAVRTKLLHIYYPDEMLPVYSSVHLSTFLRRLGRAELVRASPNKSVTLNRALLEELRSLPEAKGLSTVALGKLLYQWYDPRSETAGQEYELSAQQVEELLETLRRHFSDFHDFENPGERFAKEETSSKRRVLEKYNNELGNEKLRQMVDSGRGQEALKQLSHLIGSYLVSFQSWNPSFGTEDESASDIIRAFLDVAPQPFTSGNQLKPIMDAIARHKLKPAWDTMSTTLWAMNPEQYFPVKITYFRKLAEYLGTELPKGRPGPNNFTKVMSFGRAFEEALETLLPKDWIDIQSFIWAVSGAYDNVAPAETDKDAGPSPTYAIQDDENTAFPLNQILYGPPGTGKTFSTRAMAVEIIDGDAPSDPADLKARYDELVESAQIEFVTFHQSYTYEDFVEGIRPVMESADRNGAPRYECRDGVFKKICSSAADLGSKGTGKSIDPSTRHIWKMSLGDTSKPEEEQVYEECIDGGFVALSYGVSSDLSDCDNLPSVEQQLTQEMGDSYQRHTAQILHRFKNEMQVGDLVVVTDGNRKFRAIGEVTGEYELRPTGEYTQTRSVEWIRVFEESQPKERLLRSKNFSQLSLYRLKNEDIKLPSLAEMLAPQTQQGEKPYVLIIDEINRANISKVLGELVTLLEADKRKGAQHELRVTLPYSQESFVVPRNVYIVGTMNTADKSISLVDVALRRRFVFQELLPNFDLCPSLTDQMRVVLGELNRRITLRKDRDHQLGHAYFMGVDAVGAFNKTFRDNIVPLLQEYFYNDWDGLRYVLGEDTKQGSIVVEIPGVVSKWARNTWCWYYETGGAPVDFLRTLYDNYGLTQAASDAQD